MIPGCVQECPGCRYRNLSRGESAEKKTQWIQSLFPTIAIAPIAEPHQRWNYRKKVILHARFHQSWQFGLILRRRREEFFVNIPDCPIHHSWINRVLNRLAKKIPAQIPLVFIAITGKSLTLVLKAKREESLREELKELGPSMHECGAESVWINWNPGAGNRVFDSKRMDLLHGEPWLKDEDVWHGPMGFRQQIPELEEKAQQLAAQHLSGAKMIVDLYSGLGLSLKRWGELKIPAIGVELNGESVEASEKNAPHTKVLRGRAEDRIFQLSEMVANQGSFSLFTNPPRTGQGLKVNEWILSTEPEKIVYLSCNAKSLARDMEALNAKYAVSFLQPFDFFPQTDHVEVLALLDRKSIS